MSDGAEIVEHLRRIFDRRSAFTPSSVTAILGSSRQFGNTRILTDAVFEHLDNARIVDLSNHKIAPYDYQHSHEWDDFFPLAENMAQSQAIVFASPVYWYSMSAQMKAFFDRLTDLTEKHGDLGRSLAGKTAFAITTSGGKTPPPSFEPPFAETAGYFNMNWGGMLHGYFEEDRELSSDIGKSAAAFAERIKSAIGARDGVARRRSAAA